MTGAPFLTPAWPRMSDPAWFDRPPEDLARHLLGLCLVTARDGGITAGRIIEVEAYLMDGDAAAHSARGPTPANRTLFGRPGHLYVHPMRQRCGADIVARGGSVLLRALEPLSGIDMMGRRRGDAGERLLLSGPARLTEALGITRSDDGASLFDGRSTIWLAEPAGLAAVADIRTTARVGLTRAVDLPLRFYIPGSRFLSRPEARGQKNA